jgi:hypothetical protein
MTEKGKMRLTERSALVGLCSLLICLSVSAQIRLFRGSHSTPSPMESQIGFYLPFAAFALLSAYHYFEWARKHRFQAVLLMTILVSFALLVGLASAVGNSGTYGNTHPPEGVNLVEPPASSGQTVVQPPVGSSVMQRNLEKLGETLNSAPYMSTMLGAIEIAMSAVALAIIFTRGRYRRAGRERIENQKQVVAMTSEFRNAPLTSRDIVVEEYLKAVRFLKAKGLNIPDSDTPDEAMRRVERAWPDRWEHLKSLTPLYQEAKFSLHRISETHVNSASKLRVSITAEVPQQ